MEIGQIAALSPVALDLFQVEDPTRNREAKPEIPRAIMTVSEVADRADGGELRPTDDRDAR